MRNSILPVLLVLLVFTPFARSDEPGKKATIAYVQKLQTSTGGFLSMVPAPNVRIAPTLRATSSAIRALHYLGAAPQNKEACEKFVDSCFDATSGGFSDFPKGKPDVFTTAVGIMAVTELKMPTDKYGPAAVKFLAENAKTFEEIRIAIAGLERLGEKSPRAQAWLEETRKLLNDNGAAGKGAGQARDTGSVVVTILRLGDKVEKAEPIVKILDAGQRNNGGYGKGDDEQASDLETSYRIMRCYVMLKRRPADVEALRSYVAKCRNEDGGYGISVDQPSTVGSTYFAVIINHWLNQKN